MDLPSFSEFRNTISDERFAEICSKAKGYQRIQIVGGFTDENISAFCSELMVFVLQKSLNVQMALLEEYHEWLRENV